MCEQYTLQKDTFPAHAQSFFVLRAPQESELNLEHSVFTLKTELRAQKVVVVMVIRISHLHDAIRALQEAIQRTSPSTHSTATRSQSTTGLPRQCTHAQRARLPIFVRQASLTRGAPEDASMTDTHEGKRAPEGGAEDQRDFTKLIRSVRQEEEPDKTAQFEPEPSSSSSSLQSISAGSVVHHHPEEQ